MVKTFAQALDLVDDPLRIAEYERHHREAWPEVIHGLRSIGIRDLRIWRTGTRLFMTLQVPEDFNPAHDYQSYAEDPRCRAWDELMRDYQRRVPSADPSDGGWWTPMTEIFNLEEQDQ
ncbi:MAG: L-fucose mutarotase [Planctomycetaceae bacterium]|nr:L-fucose mutarotase [Planctomycetaceae bacterium]